MWTRKKLVLLHLAGESPSIEGVLTGTWAGHYVLRLAKVLESAEATHTLDGPEVRVPFGRVVFVQVLK